MKDSDHYLSSYDFGNFPWGRMDELDGHKTILKVPYDHAALLGHYGILEDLFPVTFGTVEFYFRTEDASDLTRMVFARYRGFDTFFPVFFYVQYDNWRYRYYTQSGYQITSNINLGGNTPQDNTWHHIKIEFDCRSGGGYSGLSGRKWRLTVDGYSSSQLNMWIPWYETPLPEIKIDYIDFWSRVNNPDGASYYDAVGFSWESGYDVGDNLKEGIPVVFETLIDREFNWYSYSLDFQTNKTIPGNKTIKMPDYGSHSIQIYGEDEYGYVYGSDIINFHIGPFNIINPHEDSGWEEGSAYDITWTSEGIIGNVLIDIFKGKVPKFSIPVTENDGIYTWAIPNDTQRGSDWRIKIMDSNNISRYTWSDYFSILSYIKIISPNNLSSLESGLNHTITWEPKGSINLVDIDLYKGGIFNLSIALGTDNNGEFLWYIPFGIKAGDDWELKITDPDNSSIYDWSGEFEIFTYKSITIIKPTSHTRWERGSIQYITWTSTGNITHVDIDAYKGNSPIYSIANGTMNDWAKYWEIPISTIPGDNWRIKISNSHNTSLFTFSDYFEIYSHPDILITNPHDVSYWEAGSSQYITWATSVRSNTTHVNIDVYKGANPIYSLGKTECDGEYLWTIPDDPQPGDDWNIVITDSDNPSIYDRSDPFEIYTDKSIIITTPSINTNWSASRTENLCRTITWTSTGAVSSVNIEVYQLNTLIFYLANQTENDGLYNWFIPSDIEPRLDWRVRIIVSDYLWIDDYSNLFVIHIIKTVTVTFPNSTENWRGGQYYDLTWETTGDIPYVNIELWKNNVYEFTIETFELNDGRYLWRIPREYESEDATYKIKVMDSRNRSVFDFSDNVFQIGATPEVPQWVLPLVLVGVGTVGSISTILLVLYMKKKIRK